MWARLANQYQVIMPSLHLPTKRALTINRKRRSVSADLHSVILPRTWYQSENTLFKGAEHSFQVPMPNTPLL